MLSISGDTRLRTGRRTCRRAAITLALVSTVLLASAAAYAGDDPLVGTWQSVDNPRWKLTVSHPDGHPNTLKLGGA